MKESETQKAILEWLDWKHIFHYRNNSGAFVDSNKHFYRFGAVGSPDIVFVVNGQYAGIEVKASKGRQSDNQKEFQRQLEAAGGRYILAHSLDDVVNAFPKAAWNTPTGVKPLFQCLQSHQPEVDIRRQDHWSEPPLPPPNVLRFSPF